MSDTQLLKGSVNTSSGGSHSLSGKLASGTKLSLPGRLLLGAWAGLAFLRHMPAPCPWDCPAAGWPNSFPVAAVTNHHKLVDLKKKQPTYNLKLIIFNHYKMYSSVVKSIFTLL